MLLHVGIGFEVYFCMDKEFTFMYFKRKHWEFLWYTVTLVAQSIYAIFSTFIIWEGALSQ